MGNYKYFKIAVFCTAQNMVRLSEKALHRQLDWFEKYCGCDKVYIEPYRDSLTIPPEQLEMLIRVFRERGVEVSGALTTTVNNLSPGDEEKYRMSGTYCYVNKAMREHLVEKVKYIAGYFDEFIIDDWFFTMCTCHECREAKGERSWEDFRTELLADVSENLIVETAKSVNKNCKIIIKYPNWVEAYQESGYDPARQRHIFDYIYTGTETRDTPNTDQHLPRYLSYSLHRLLENYAPGRNGGAWFDPYGCSPIDIYLEQAYLSAFSRAKELLLFCWGSLYKNRVVTPLGLQMESIDKFLDKAGNCIGTPCYIPAMAQGEDHLEDFLGMVGIPFEHTPDFPADSKALFLTVQAHKDPDIMKKLKEYVVNGGKAIVTSGFMIQALGKGIEEMTSIRYNGRRFRTNRFRGGAFMFGADQYSEHEMGFPLLEHRNNTTWALAKAVVGEENYPIILRDNYGKGQLVTIVVPDEYGYIYDLPENILDQIRLQFTDVVPYKLNGPGQASLFAYDNDTFAVYKYTDKLKAGSYGITVRGNADSLTSLSGRKMEIPPASRGNGTTTFNLFVMSGDLNYYRINWSEKRFEDPRPFFAASAPDDFVDEEDE
jgi:hypothetical protein